MALQILSTGTGLSLQDGGRPGWLRYGVPQGGAMDRHTMRAANALLGNQPDAPVLEIFRQGACIKVLDDTWIALAGADFCPALEAWSAAGIKAGSVLECSAKASGLFAYLAVPGGFVADCWLGSAATDTRNGLGMLLRAGQELAPAMCGPNAPVEGVARRLLIQEERRSYAAKETFNLLPGPQFEAFSEKSRQTLVTATWQVTAQSDRTGYRLEGPALEVPSSIRSEPVLPGSFQVPGSGQPIITMVDGPTVGGYPKIAILADADRDRLAQSAPGTQLQFLWADS